MLFNTCKPLQHKYWTTRWKETPIGLPYKWNSKRRSTSHSVKRHEKGMTDCHKKEIKKSQQQKKRYYLKPILLKKRKAKTQDNDFPPGDRNYTVLPPPPANFIKDLCQIILFSILYAAIKMPACSSLLCPTKAKALLQNIKFAFFHYAM